MSYIDLDYFKNTYKFSFLEDDTGFLESDFVYFAERASDYINFRLNNQIEETGFDNLVIAEQTKIQKATATLIDFFYKNGYNQEGDANITIAGASVSSSTEKLEIPQIIFSILASTDLYKNFSFYDITANNAYSNTGRDDRYVTQLNWNTEKQVLEERVTTLEESSVDTTGLVTTQELANSQAVQDISHSTLENLFNATTNGFRSSLITLNSNISTLNNQVAGLQLNSHNKRLFRLIDQEGVAAETKATSYNATTTELFTLYDGTTYGDMASAGVKAQVGDKLSLYAPNGEWQGTFEIKENIDPVEGPRTNKMVVLGSRSEGSTGGSGGISQADLNTSQAPQDTRLDKLENLQKTFKRNDNNFLSLLISEIDRTTGAVTNTFMSNEQKTNSTYAVITNFRINPPSTIATTIENSANHELFFENKTSAILPTIPGKWLTFPVFDIGDKKTLRLNFQLTPRQNNTIFRVELEEVGNSNILGKSVILRVFNPKRVEELTFDFPLIITQEIKNGDLAISYFVKNGGVEVNGLDISIL